MNHSTSGLPVHHNSRSLPELMSIESVTPSSHLTLCRLLLHPPSIFPGIRGFSNESVLHIRWPQYWSFSSNISPSKEYSGGWIFTSRLKELSQGSLPWQQNASVLGMARKFIRFFHAILWKTLNKHFGQFNKRKKKKKRWHNYQNWFIIQLNHKFMIHS